MADPGTTVVLIGGRAHREFQALHDLGYRILYLDKRVPLHLMAWVDVPVDVDTDDWDLVAKVVRAQLDGEVPAAVLTHVEPRIPLMAHLAEHLLPEGRGLTTTAARNCRDKWHTRKVLTEAGLPVPRYGLAEATREAAQIARDIGFPVVVKPRDGAGAFGVRRCETVAEARIAAGNVLDEASPDALSGVLVEEYLDGPEYAVQTITRGGKTRVLSVFRQHMTEPPVFVELGYDYPSGLSDDELRTLELLVTSVLDALGVDDWVSHTQVRLCADGFRVVEVNARRPGGRLVEMTEAVSGVDMVDAVSRLALGLPVEEGEPRALLARYRSVVFDEAGTLLYQAPSSSAFPSIVEMEVPSGDQVQPVDHPEGGVYGRTLVFADSVEDLDEAERQARGALDLRVAPPDDLAWAVAESREFKSCC
ncbi:MAG TPA: ATP-grasp domain-containing protein [Umezawaea sp.]|nr:ATP-grasp domain-containing protein [Umezawaea sp.]